MRTTLSLIRAPAANKACYMSDCDICRDSLNLSRLMSCFHMLSCAPACNICAWTLCQISNSQLKHFSFFQQRCKVDAKTEGINIPNEISSLIPGSFWGKWLMKHSIPTVKSEEINLAGKPPCAWWLQFPHWIWMYAASQ